MSLKNSKTKSDFLEWEKFQTLILKLERDEEMKFALLISTGCYLGLRISDLLQMRWKDILFNDFYVLNEGKTGKERRVTINPELKVIVQRIHDRVLPNVEEQMFLNRFKTKTISVQHVNVKLKEVFAKYSIKGQYSSHFMRKTLGRRVWSVNNYSEQALILLSQLFNHSSIQTTKIYLGIRDQEISNLYLSV